MEIFGEILVIYNAVFHKGTKITKKELCTAQNHIRI
jgi:hypothetical protein